MPNQARAGFELSSVGELHYHTDKALQDASDIFECCLLAREVLGGTKYASPVH
jgi:hypothetical protein